MGTLAEIVEESVLLYQLFHQSCKRKTHESKYMPLLISLTHLLLNAERMLETNGTLIKL